MEELTGSVSRETIQRRKLPGFTDCLAVACVLLLFIGLNMSYRLSVMSIEADYMGALQCFTVVFTPIGTMLGIVLTAVVQKNRAENTSADGGINCLKQKAAVDYPDKI